MDSIEDIVTKSSLQVKSLGTNVKKDLGKSSDPLLLKLNEKYEPKTGANKMKLKREFAASKLKNEQSPDEWISELELLRAKLKRLGTEMDDDVWSLELLPREEQRRLYAPTARIAILWRGTSHSCSSKVAQIGFIIA